MRILFAHNRYQLAAGEEMVVQAEMALLQEQGNAVSLFEVDNRSIQSPWSKLKAAAASVYSWSARQELCQRIEQFRPDVVHVHNFFPLLSPSVYDACQMMEVPVVQTLHNYRLTCVNGKLFRDGQICESCLGQSIPWAGIRQGCYRDSVVESAAVGVMIGVHQMRRTWGDRVNAFIALTPFQKAKMTQAGLPPERIHVKPNFLFDPQLPPRQTPGDYLLYVGRLWSEKGIQTLVDAYLQHDISMPLKIVGEGIMRENLEQQVQRAGKAIEFLGWRSKPEVLALMQNARALVFPSVWYETFGLTMIEAFACRVPVIASRLGGIAEIVQSGETGLLFEAGNGAELAEQLEWAIAHPQAMQVMGQNARQVYENRYSPTANYEHLVRIYEKVGSMN
ncbi:MAG: glycosyltransferase family 4 protein [Oculatellaceae cyanobacterium Prado106]|jgi:glycosyltransferase involved in cell wall biosynthesis|nr:glycosyltransferase family 4 protein [Oculatellaceae cyanobacterium Prado106]